MNETEVQSQEDNELISQASYAPTPYADSSWEIVGEALETKDFIPMGIELLPRTYSFVDPMFADYGGDPAKGHEQRWHLPDEVAVTYQQQVQQGIQQPVQEQVQRTGLSDEEVEAIRQQAFMEGQQAGLEAAVSANAEKMELAESRMLQLMEDLNTQIRQQGRQVERRAVELAMKVALKIVHQTVSINPEYIVPIIQEALGLVGTSSIRAVRVSSQDLEFIRLMGIEKSIKEFDGSWEFVADETVKTGCIVDTSAGEIDFQLGPAWERIKDKVVKVL
jgi:flagellar assembly protein FliH